MPLMDVAPLFGNGQTGPKGITEPENVNFYTGGFGDNNDNGMTTTQDISAFKNGSLVYIHLTRGPNHGQQMLNRLTAVGSNSIGLAIPLNGDYPSEGENLAQIVQVPEYTSLDIDDGGVLNCGGWDGISGGISCVSVRNKTTLAGEIDISDLGFVGGRTGFLNDGSLPHTGELGEGVEIGFVEGDSASSDSSGSVSPVNTPAGVGQGGAGTGSRGPDDGSGAGGPSFATEGGTAVNADPSTGGVKGTTYGTDDLSDKIDFGTPGSGAGKAKDSGDLRRGGRGVGLSIVMSNDFEMQATGFWRVDGQKGDDGLGQNKGGASPATGGSAYLISKTADIGVDQFSALPGDIGLKNGSGTDSGPAGRGRIRTEACGPITGSIDASLYGSYTTLEGGQKWCGASLIGYLL